MMTQIYASLVLFGIHTILDRIPIWLFLIMMDLYFSQGA